jgi:hypothetical protein
MAVVPSSTNATIPSFWGKSAKKSKNDKALMSRTRMLTLAYGEMETVKILPDSYSVSIHLRFGTLSLYTIIS